MLVNVEFERLNEPSRFFGFFHSVYTAWIILGLSLALTVLAYVLTHAAVQQRWKDHFDFKAQELEQAILDRTALYEQVLWGGVGLFNANDAQVDRKRFALYVDALNLNEHWPGVQGVGFSVPVAPNELAAHVCDQVGCVMSTRRLFIWNHLIGVISVLLDLTCGPMPGVVRPCGVLVMRDARQ
ncbi:MAG: CHASE domain-containing protein [Gammaproteobacteria bacterium]